MKILFICTHNRCRSVLCEAITNDLAKGRISAYSAGSQPAGEVHPLTIKYLQQRGINTQGLKSRSWDEFEHIHPDVVITVCDDAANESCPVWFGDSVTVHWALPDPSRQEGSPADVENAFQCVMGTVERRIRALLDQHLDKLSGGELKSQLQNLVLEG